MLWPAASKEAWARGEQNGHRWSMTLLCVRLERSFGIERLTALADTRAAVPRNDGSYRVVSDTTVKLFAVPVRCYGIDSLTSVGAWQNPYFETLLGLGFSGSCFEALTVIAHLTQSLSALVAPNGDQPTPTGEGLVLLVRNLTETYFTNYKFDVDSNPVLQMLVFGFENNRPWVGKISWNKVAGIAFAFDWASADTLETVGQGALFEQYAGELRKRIEKHKSDIRLPRADHAGDDTAFAHELSLARHDIAEKKSTEEAMLKQIESEFFGGIGGVLQRLELALDNDCVVAAFTQDDRPYFGGASCSVAPDAFLGPIPFVEKMGRQIRKPGV